MENETVHPRNFLGLELNPRAAAIAELVLWLGYLQCQMRNKAAITDPVLEKLKNITAMDAVLRHDGERAKPDDSGTELIHPRRPDWPQADYIVGNPPFIGGKDVRSRLGEPYAVALWKANPKINKSADFVMYWWDHAAEILAAKGSRLKRSRAWPTLKCGGAGPTPSASPCASRGRCRRARAVRAGAAAAGPAG